MSYQCSVFKQLIEKREKSKPILQKSQVFIADGDTLALNLLI